MSDHPEDPTTLIEPKAIDSSLDREQAPDVFQWDKRVERVKVDGEENARVDAPRAGGYGTPDLSMDGDMHKVREHQRDQNVGDHTHVDARTVLLEDGSTTSGTGEQRRNTPREDDSPGIDEHATPTPDGAAPQGATPSGSSESAAAAFAQPEDAPDLPQQLEGGAGEALSNFVPVEPMPAGGTAPEDTSAEESSSAEQPNDDGDSMMIMDVDGAANQISENASRGDRVGIIASASHGEGSEHMFSLADDANGRFAIDPMTGEVYVQAPELLDFESGSSHQIVVAVAARDGTVTTQTFEIQVTDHDEFDVSPIADSDASSNRISENASVGDRVGFTANAFDADGSENAVQYALSGNPNGAFAIDPATGVVSIADPAGLDFEAAQSMQIEVTATSEDGSTSSQTFDITITDVDEFDVSATSDSDTTTNSVAENAAVGDTVGVSAFASDADGSNSTVQYSLSQNPNNGFRIDATTGEVSVANPSALDFESAQSMRIEVTATSDDGSTSTQTFDIAISDIDEFDVSAVTDSDAAADTVAENAAVGDSVGVTAFASDADGSNNGIQYSLSQNPNSAFAIDANTGEVTVADPAGLDFESAQSMRIEITATSDDGSTSTQTFDIAVNDVDEFDVSAVSDADDATNVIAENASAGDAVGVTAFASDADGSSNTVQYSLRQNPNDAFAIDANTGEVTVANPAGLDFESAQSMRIEVTATSDDGSTSTRTFDIAISDVDEFDVSAVSESDGAANTVAEDAVVGDSVGITAFANDGDGSNNSVQYSLSQNPNNAFAIDANTGEVTVADPAGLDFESAQSMQIEVTATSDDGSTSAQTFDISVTDVDEFDVSAVSDTDGATNAIAENASVGDTVGVTAFASDADDSNNGVQFSLSQNPNSAFAIDANTGEVTVADPAGLDFESAQSMQIEVTATSDDGSTSTQTFDVAINDVDEFDVSAVTDGDGAADTVAEDAAVGDSVGVTAFAGDADGSNNGVQYSLSQDPNSAFAIDANTGEVTVADPAGLDFESAQSMQIEVTATSDDGSTSTQTFDIAINDVDEFDVSAVSDSDGAADTVAEDAAVGDSVGITAFASDADGSNNGVQYSLSQNPNSAFAIDANTGEVTVADPAGLDFESTQSMQIEVTATSDDGSTSSQTFDIAITDVDEFDVSAVSDTDGTANAVSEAASAGDTVGVTAFASDADGSDSGVQYSLSQNPNNAFAVDASTGEVTVADPAGLDFESAQSMQIEVTATSEDGSTSTQTFDIAINDVDEFDVSAVSDSDSDSAVDTVAENASVGDTVGITAFATDADGSINTVQYSLSQNPNNAFAIDGDTGEVTVADPAGLDFESAQSMQIEVTATSDDGSSSTQIFDVAVTDVDEFDVSAVTDTDSAADTVAENASVGDTVGVTAFASDADGSSNSVQYSLSQNPNNAFTIDTNTGEVTVADPAGLDFESAQSMQIEVTATSDDGSTSSQTFDIAITDVDEFDVSAVSDSDGAADTVAEDAAVGESVGVTAFANDADGSNNSVQYSLSQNPNSAFAIDANTGEVTVADPAGLDFESAQAMQIEVTATSVDGSTSTQTFDVAVTDVDEFDVSAVSDTASASDTVAENASVGDTVGVTAFASDADGSNSGVQYSLSQNPNNAFAIDANTGEVTVADPAGLDFESAQSMQIEVTATSDDGSTSSQTFDIAVSDVDEFDVSAVSDTDGATNTISESASVGDTVGVTAFASDADGSNNGVQYSLSQNPNSAFAIDANTGEITVADPAGLDFESAQSMQIEVTATSDDGSTSTQTFDIAITDVDEFDVSAVSDSDGAADTVAENAAVGDSGGVTAFASDADGSNNGVQYSLSQNPNNAFAVDANTGEVTVADPAGLDFESAQSMQIEVTATSDDGSTSTQTFDIAISDVDEFDVSAVSDTDGATNAIAENASTGDTVGVTAFASDADGSSNTVQYSLSQNPNSAFAIDANTGEVTVADPDGLDFESAQSMQIEVTATSDDGSTSTQTFDIAITDVDEFDVSAVSDTDSASDAIAENASVGDTVGVTAFASDADGSNNGVQYSLSQNPNSAFSIDANTGEVTVADPAGLDFESAQSMQIEVTATSDDGSTSTQTFDIAITDVDEFDVSAVSDTDNASDTVAENASVGDTVGVTAFASDADGSNNSVQYSLSQNPNSAFTIDANTGEVTVADPAGLDFESAQSMQIEVTATSDDGSTSTQTFDIAITDVDEFDVSAVSDTDSASDAIAENASAGDSVGVTAFASDADGSNNGVQYSLSQNPNSAFSIDANTGEVTVADPAGLDFESAQSMQIEVTATSDDGSTSTQTFDIAVGDVDEFDVSAVSDTDNATDTVAENASVGDTVGVTAFASDADGSNNGVQYSLSQNPNNAFAVDANTGEVTVANPAGLDFESAQSMQIEVTATSDDGSTSSQTFDIAISDVDEFDVSAVNDSDGAADTVAEDAAVGDSVGVTAFASDADGSNNSVQYSLSQNPNSAFAIDANTGEVTVADPAGLDFESAQSMQIEVTATSDDGSTSTQTFDIAVTDVDEFDVSAVSDTDNGSDTVAENAAVGDSVGVTAFASDGDGSNNSVEYSLSQNPNNAFAIDANTGEVTVADPAGLDFESAQSMQIEVTATSDDGSTSTEIFDIEISDHDEFDTSAVSDSDGAADTVAENASVGDSVGVTAFASDADGSSNAIQYSLSQNPNNAFAVDANTGEVTVANPAGLDFESAEFMQIEVTATSDDGSSSFQTFNIAISDHDEFDISTVSDADGAVNSINESASVGDTVGVTALAQDGDGSDAVTYSLSSNPNSAFAIDADSGVVTVADPSGLDFETAQSMQIEVTATSDDGSSSTQTFDIAITDDDEFDVTPILDVDGTSDLISEHAAAGDSVGITASAVDQDGSDGVTFSLSSNPNNAFAIDGTSGVVTVADPSALDFETAQSMQIEVTATSDDGSVATQTFDVAVGNEFDVLVDTDSAENIVTVTGGPTQAPTSVAIDIEVPTTVLPGSELTFTVAGVPDGSTLSAGTLQGDGTWQVAADEVAGLTMTAPADGSGAELTITPHEFLQGQNLLINGSFESELALSYNYVTDLVGWEVIGQSETWASGVMGMNASDGNVSLELDAHAHGGAEGIYQDVNLAQGEVHQVSFDVRSRAGTSGSTNTVEVYWNGALVTSVTPGSTEWETVTFEVTGSAGTDQLMFMEAASQSDSMGAHLDNVIVLPPDQEHQHSTQTVTYEGFDLSAADGDAVGITASAPEASGGVTYSLSDNPNDAFAIDAQSGEVTVGDEDAVRALGGNSVQLEITATTADGATTSEHFTVQVRDGDAAETFTGGAGDDTVDGAGGDDLYQFFALDTGHNTFDGGTGWDSVELEVPTGSDDTPWTIEVDGQTLDYDLQAGSIDLDPDSSGTIIYDDGSQLEFDRLDHIFW